MGDIAFPQAHSKQQQGKQQIQTHPNCTNFSHPTPDHHTNEIVEENYTTVSLEILSLFHQQHSEFKKKIGLPWSRSHTLGVLHVSTAILNVFAET